MPTPGEAAADRKVFEITGKDRESFLQGLVTNDLGRVQGGIVYAAMLSPQGKYLADFFLVPAGDAILLDVQAGLAEGLLRRLAMYRLRADVRIVPSPFRVSHGRGVQRSGARTGILPGAFARVEKRPDLREVSDRRWTCRGRDDRTGRDWWRGARTGGRRAKSPQPV